MPDKENIFDNVTEYSSEELAQYIMDGLFSIDELCDYNNTRGLVTPKKRKEIKDIIDSTPAPPPPPPPLDPDDEAWAEAQRIRTLAIVENYLYKFPMGKHRAEAVQLKNDIIDDATWEEAKQKRSYELVKKYLADFPNGRHVGEALQLKKELRPVPGVGGGPGGRGGIRILVNKIKEIPTFKNREYEGQIVDDVDAKILDVIEQFVKIRGIVTAEELLAELHKDINLLDAWVIRNLYEKEILDYDDLPRLGVDNDFIEKLFGNNASAHFDKPDPIDMINMESTEVYFWGIPSSGKSCALGAILSAANSGEVAKSMHPDVNCQGYGYMTRLSSLFRKNRISVLPPGTPTCSTYEMAFSLVDENSKVHPITCIDLAGELVRCMFKQNAGETLRNDEENALDTITKLLHDNRTKNRKIHFFVLEYGAENREYEGLPQSIYLDAALNYIRNYNVFETDTDAIYLLMTKVDKTGLKGEELKRELGRYIREIYGGFYGALKTICETNEINNGVVDIVPFSVGTVCFQDFCKFDPVAANNVVRKLLNRSFATATGFKAKFKFLKG